jgi:hypothetical protein
VAEAASAAVELGEVASAAAPVYLSVLAAGVFQCPLGSQR